MTEKEKQTAQHYHLYARGNKTAIDGDRGPFTIVWQDNISYLLESIGVLDSNGCGYRYQAKKHFYELREVPTLKPTGFRCATCGRPFLFSVGKEVTVTNLKPGTVWEHYLNGGHVTVLHIANADSRRKAQYPPTVVYSMLVSGKVYCRELDNFLATMTFVGASPGSTA